MKISDKLGQRFNRLLVIGESEKKYNGRTIWVCKCDCGKLKEVVGANLMSGSIQSCGCLRSENGPINARKAKRTGHGMSWTRPWRIWVKMRRRCSDPKEINYKRYGGRGIKVCERWSNSFENFWEDTKDGYADNLTLDRIDNAGNYEASNCKWSTILEQNKNKRLRIDGRFTKK